MWRSFLPARLAGVVLKFTPISHRSIYGLQNCLGLMEVLPDELAISAKHHFDILVPQLLGNVPRVGHLSGVWMRRCAGAGRVAIGDTCPLHDG